MSLKVEIARFRETFPHRADELMRRVEVVEIRLTTTRTTNRLYMEFMHSMLVNFNTFMEESMM